MLTEETKNLCNQHLDNALQRFDVAQSNLMIIIEKTKQLYDLHTDYLNNKIDISQVHSRYNELFYYLDLVDYCKDSGLKELITINTELHIHAMGKNK